MKKVLTNGCFDLLHQGHIQLLKECASMGDEVIVALNTDDSIKKLKLDVPINNFEIRSANLLNTKLVDKIIAFNKNEELIQIIKDEQPNFLVKGADYVDQKIIGQEEIEAIGGKVHLAKFIDGYSSTNIKMLKKFDIIVTGALGFIGSNFVKFLNDHSIYNILLVDDLKTCNDKWKNVVDLKFVDLIDYRYFESVLDNTKTKITDYIINLGACSSTSESNINYLWETNTNFTRKLIKYVANNSEIILLHASSAATYGLSDNFKERIYDLEPLNKYGFSKLISDRLIEDSINCKNLKNIFSFRFFNVYGPREEYKGEMKSIITKFIQQDLLLKERFPNSLEGRTAITDSSPFKSFKSYKQNVEDGEMKRDFIHVYDVCKILLHFMLIPRLVKPGIYNVGTGKASSVNEVLKIINPYRQISYEEMPEKLRPIYQYYTQADITKLRNDAHYTFDFLSLKEGIEITKEYYRKKYQKN